MDKLTKDDHEGCRYYALPESNTVFWQKKAERNRTMDIEDRRQITSTK